MTETNELEARLATLAHRHRSPGRRRLEAIHLGPCIVPTCGDLGRLFPRGRLCPVHMPEQPDAAASLPAASPPRPEPVYGRATTDPLGRTVIDPRSRLPRRAEA